MRVASTVLLVAGVVVASCGTDDDGSGPDGDDRVVTTSVDSTTPVRCIVRLHGKGGSGAQTSVADDGTQTVSPTGNEDGWGARQWIYDPASRYDEARDLVGRAIDGCDVAVVNGFSNGASFAAAMFCAGESFGGIVQGYVIDDPVTDTATEGCAPAAGVDVAMYWTSSVAQPAGTDCATIDWTCAGGTTVDVDTYAARLGTTVEPSPFSDHEWFRDAPEITEFLTTGDSGQRDTVPGAVVGATGP